VIQSVREHSDVPIAAYNVSGEYAMIKAAAANGWLNEQKTVLEILGSIRRAGADIIFSYHTPDVSPLAPIGKFGPVSRVNGPAARTGTGPRDS